MRYRDQEEIEGLFQTWPNSFKERFGRELTKAEIISVIQLRMNELEQQAIKTAFSDFNHIDLCLALDFLNQHQIDHIIDKAQKLNAFNTIKTKKLDHNG